MTYRVEFNTTGYYSGNGIWETLDEICEIKANNAQEAIVLAQEWYFNNSECDESIMEYAWRTAEIKFDEDGYIENYVWELWEF